MKKNLKIRTKLLSKNRTFNERLTQLIQENNIPIEIEYSIELEALEEIDIVIIDKNYYSTLGLSKINNKTKYIMYLLDQEDYNFQFIKGLYENKVFDIFHSHFIPKSLERKLWALVKLISEDDTDQLLDIILDSIEDSIAITNDQGILEYVNKGFLKTSGYELNEVIDKNPSVLKSDGHTAGFYKELWRTITRGDIWHGNFINLSKSGNLVYEKATVYPIDLSSRKYLKIGHNITKKRFLENKVRLSMSLAKSVLSTSAPNAFQNSHIKFNYFVKYMNELGGDFIWFNQIGKKKYFTALIDVTGHDLSSTLILMTIISFIKEYKAVEALGTLTERINNYLTDFNKKSDIVKLISGIFCLINLENSYLEYINAGHPSGLVFDKETLKLTELRRNTLLLGVRDNLSYKSIVLPINGTFDLLLYSDGLLEHYIDNYEEITPKIYQDIFYDGKTLKFSKIKNELMSKDYIEDDLSLAHIRFGSIGGTDVN